VSDRKLKIVAPAATDNAYTPTLELGTTQRESSESTRTKIPPESETPLRTLLQRLARRQIKPRAGACRYPGPKVPRDTNSKELYVVNDVWHTLKALIAAHPSHV